MMAFGAKIKLTVDTSGASAFRKNIQDYVNAATVERPIKLKHFSVSMTKDQQKKIVKEIQAYLSNDTTLTLKIGEIDATGAVNKLRQQLQTMLSGLSITGLKEFLGETNIDKITQDIDKAKQSASQWAAQMCVIDDIQKSLGSTYRSALSGSQMVGDATQVQQITAAYTAWQIKVEELRNTKIALSAEEIQSLQEEGIALQQKITLIQEEQAATVQAANEADRAAKQEEVAARKALNLAQQQVSLKSQVQRYIMSNSRAYKAYGDQLDGIMHQLTAESKLTEEELKAIRMRFNEIQTSAKAAGVSGNTFFDTMKKGFVKFGGWSLVTRTLMAVYRVFRDMITAVKELDAAMTELRKVTDLSEKSYRNYLNTAKQLSQTVGATLADTVNATADFARLGYSITESTALAEAALVYKNVGDGIEDIGTASESLISTIKAFEQFGESANNAMSIIDRFNEVGNNFAISSEGIGSALQRSASSLAAAGNSLNQSIALVTGMNAVVQDPEKVGTALKTISMYLRAAKTEAEEAGESTDGMASSVSELRKELLTLTKGRVDIMLDDKKFKSTYEVMKDLSQVWGDLADIDQANILELIGGKRNANAVTSLLTNFEDAEKALQTAAQASGSALAENEKYLDSIAGKLSVLQSKFETFSTDLIDSGAVKFVVDLGSGLLTLLDVLTRIYALLPLIGVSTLTVAKAMDARKVGEVTSQVMLQKKTLLEEKIVTDNLAVSVSGLSAQQQKHLIIQLQRKVASEEITKEQYEQIVSTLGLSSAAKGLVATDGALIVANKGVAASFKTLMASVPVWGWIALGISLLLEFVTILGDVIGNVETSSEKIARLNDEFEGISEKIKGIASEYSELKKSTDDIIPRFVELAKGVNEFGENISLTDEEYEEFLSLNNQIAEMFPELDMGIDSNGNHILALSYSVDTLAESLQALVDVERMAANEEIAGNMGEALKNIKSVNKEYNNELEALKAKKDEISKTKNNISDEFKGESPNLPNLKTEFSGKLGSYAAEMQEAEWLFDDSAVQESLADKAEEWDALINREISAVENKQKAAWQKINSILGYWLQSTDDYNASSDNVQQLMSKIVGNIDYSSIDITDEKQLQEHITSNFIRPIANAAPEVQNAMVGLFDIKSAFDSGALTVGEYGITDYILGDLQKAGVSDAILSTLKESLNLEDFTKRKTEVTNGIKDFSKDAQDLTNKIRSAADEYNKLVNGNVDYTKRPLIEPEKMLGAGWEEFESEIATTYTQGITIGEGDALYTLSITPILENGKVLSPEELDEYVGNLVTDGGTDKLLESDYLNLVVNVDEGDYNEGYWTKLEDNLQRIKNKHWELVKQLREENPDGSDILIKFGSIEEYINSLSASELNIAYEIINENGSITLDELHEKIRQVRYESANMVEPLNMSGFMSGLIDGLNGTAKAVDKVTSAMAKLQEGTALSKKEIVDLIDQYPQLLQQADIFANGSVEAQKNALNAILDMQEQEYDAQIGAKIAELKATEQVLNNQLELEEQKANLIQEIKNMESNGKIAQETDFINKLTELNDLQGQNYVSFKEGELQVNEEALNDQLQQGSDFANEATENIWQPYGETIVTSHTQGYSAAMTATNNYTLSLGTRIKNFVSNIGSAVATAWRDMWSDNWQGIDTYFSQAMGTGDTSISGGVVSVNFGGDRTTINGQAVDEWISDQEKASDYRITEIEKIKVGTVNAIKNLEALKGLDLTTIYGSTSSSSSGSSSKSNKEVEEYIANIDKYYDALKRLENAQAKVENLEKELSHTDDPAEKIKLYDQLVDAYREEANAERNLISQRTTTIRDNAAALRKLGFEVEYNASTNKLFIKNLEHLNELTATSKGKYDTLQEATNALRESTEDLIDTTEELNNDNRDSIDNIEDLTYEIQDAAEEIINCIEEVYEKQIDAYNDIIDKRKEAIESAKEEYEYEEEVADKVKEIAELQAKIDKLSLDSSREAQAQKAALMEELIEKQKDLNDTQSEHAYDAQIEELDKMAEEYEEEKNAELETLRESIGTVQDLGTVIDTRVTNAWKNAKKAVEEYGQSVAGLNGGVVTNVGAIPKYHTGGVVGGNVTGKEEVLALLESGEIVLNDQKQDTVYRIIDFHTKLAERLGVDLGRTTMPLTTLDTTLNFGGVAPGVVNTSSQTIFNPEFNIEISHNGEMSDDEARRYGEEIADTAITKLYNAFERKGISNHNGAKLRP